MSIVTVQLGQCGNEIGKSLFTLLHNDSVIPPKYTSANSAENVAYRADTCDRYFTERNDGRYEAKAVLVDMEPKVVTKCMQSDVGWKYQASSYYIQKKGSGNNWALGYYGYGKMASEHVIELCRKEVERCDWFTGFLLLMSSAGGTGSGLGSYITRALRDSFPGSLCVNHVVLPYTSGEVVVQNYNTILTMAHLQQNSDLIIAQRNDHLHAICSKLLGISQISFEDINGVIAHKLAGILQTSFAQDYRAVNTLHDCVVSLATHPAYKFSTIKSIPHISAKSMRFSTFVWPALMKHLRQMLIADAAMEEGVNWEVKTPCKSSTNSSLDMRVTNGDGDFLRKQSFNRSVANLLVLRGKDLCNDDMKSFRSAQLFSSRIPFPSCYTEWKQTRCFNNYEKCAMLMTNSQSIVRPIDTAVQKAWTMFNARAYLHQYEKYGLSDEDFIDSFASVERVVSDYSNL